MERVLALGGVLGDCQYDGQPGAVVVRALRMRHRIVVSADYDRWRVGVRRAPLGDDVARWRGDFLYYGHRRRRLAAPY